MKKSVIMWTALFFAVSITGICQADLNNGLVAYYPFSGNADDESGYRNNGTVYNANLVEGKFGTGIEFSGSLDCFVEVPHSDLLNPAEAVTLSLWMKEYGTSPAYSSLIYKAGEPPIGWCADRVYSLWTRSEQGIHLTSTPEGATSQLYCNSPGYLYQLGDFVHVVGIIDTVTHTMTIYVNGNKVQECSGYGDTIRSGNFPLRIGAPVFQYIGDQYAFNGVIDEVRIYNRALSGAEIQELYEGIPPSDFQLSFPIDGLTPHTARVTSILDHSVFANNPIKFYTKDSVVEAFNGETGQRKCKNIYITPTYSIRGCKNDTGTRFLGGVLNYTGGGEPRYLWYDGHPGYDYGIPKGTTLRASADGKLFKAVKDPVNSPRAANAWNKFHTFYIDHGNGYSSWYLHSNRLLPEIAAEIAEKGYADVVKGQPIAKSGDKGTEGQNHLHFEVRKGGFDHANIADPYKDALWE
jgi:hypothetical protein